MSKNKYAGNNLPFWATAKTNGTKDPVFIQIGVTLLKNKKYQGLSGKAKETYHAMMMECKGRGSFYFTRAQSEKYGISETSMRRAVQELLEAGFIAYEWQGIHTRTKNIFKFVDAWKKP